MKVGGWARIGIVALVIWWSYCGFLLFQNHQLSEASGYVEDPYAVPQLSGNDQAAAHGEMAIPEAVPSEGMIVAQERTKAALIGAVGLPILVLVMIAIGRWIRSGFVNGKRTPDSTDKSD